ncbi:MAG: hypothetical protein PVI77_09000, partial [Desulfobacterales bacterium]
ISLQPPSFWRVFNFADLRCIKALLEQLGYVSEPGIHEDHLTLNFENSPYDIDDAKYQRDQKKEGDNLKC